jgi:hypothetical protein
MHCSIQDQLGFDSVAESSHDNVWLKRVQQKEIRTDSYTATIKEVPLHNICVPQLLSCKNISVYYR